jgi:NAD(P)-dependent dehydrogenase (short-subunit alcohol dehydrogenase family)
MDEKTWFITGASSGLGRDIAEAALKAGDRVVATARKPQALADLRSEWDADRLIAPQLDVTSDEQTVAAVDDALRAFGAIDILCINAGFGMLGAIEEVDGDLVRKVYETNVFAPLTLLRAALPHMRAAGKGHVILVTSIGGLAANPGSAIYSSTKFALEGIGEALAQEVATFGIKVSLIEPGGLRTGFAGPSVPAGQPLEAYADLPAGRWRHVSRANHGKQAGDPKIAADIIVQIAHLAEPPLRTILGTVALERARAKAQQLLRDVEESTVRGQSIDRP